MFDQLRVRLIMWANGAIWYVFPRFWLVDTILKHGDLIVLRKRDSRLREIIAVQAQRQNRMSMLQSGPEWEM